MAKQIGEQLTELDSHDSVLVNIDGERYEGDVADTERWMCELVAGFMESGSISIYVKLSAETINHQDPPTDDLVITATENVPRDWEEPQASFHDPIEDEIVEQVGTVDYIRVVDGSFN